MAVFLHLCAHVMACACACDGMCWHVCAHMMHVCTCDGVCARVMAYVCACDGMCVEVRIIWGIAFLLSHGFQGLTSGCQAWQQVPFPAKPSCQSVATIFDLDCQ